MASMEKSPCWTLLLLAGLLCCGCGRDAGPPPPPAYTVAGTLLYDDGSPVAKALVQFVLKSNPSLNISGVTADDGTFALKTSYGNHTLSGTIEGPCHVKIVPPCSFPPPTRRARSRCPTLMPLSRRTIASF